MTPQDYSPIEQLAPDITRQIYKGRVLVLTVSSLSRATLDVWFETTKAWYSAAEMANRSIYTMQDFSPTDSGPTPYARDLTAQLLAKHPNIKGRSAIIVSESFFARLTANWIRSLEGHVERVVFPNREKGLAWLMSRVAAEVNDQNS